MLWNQRILILLIFFCASSLVFGCASSDGSAVSSMKFPSEAEVQRMASATPPAVDFSSVTDSLFLEEWSMEGVLPNHVGHEPIQASTRWESEVQQAAEGRPNSTSSQAMSCFAEQYTRFYAAHDERPPTTVRRFLAARCGWVGTTPTVRLNHYPEGHPHDSAWSNLRARFLDNMGSFRPNQPMDAAVWIGDIGSTTFVSLAMGHRAVVVDRRPIVDGDGFELHGEVLDQGYDGVNALVTRGIYDMDFCDADESVRFPEFSFTCPAHRDDHLVWFELSLKIRDQQWTRNGFAGQIWTDTPDNTYRAAPWRRAWAEHLARGASDESLQPQPLFGDRSIQGEGLEDRIVELTNIVRDMAGRQPVRIARAQSRTNSILAPFLYKASREEDWSRIDDYSRAMMAGWEIPEQILSARLRTQTVPEGDGREAVDSFLELPSGREVLTRPEIRQVAFGTIQSRGGSNWIALTGYMEVPDLTAEEMVSQAIATINAARADAGVGPLRDAENYQQASVLLSRGIQRGSHDPQKATSRVARAMANNLQTSVQSYTILTDDLTRIHMPDAVVLTPGLRAAILAAPYQEPGDPWALYRVVVIYPRGDMNL